MLVFKRASVGEVFGAALDQPRVRRGSGPAVLVLAELHFFLPEFLHVVGSKVTSHKS